jgi:hypothetical protein
MLNLLFSTSMIEPRFSLTATGGFARLQAMPAISLEWYATLDCARGQWGREQKRGARKGV